MTLAADWAAVEFGAFGTGARIVVSDPAALRRAEAAVRAELEAIGATLSRFRDDSELSRVNAQAGDWVPISPLLAAALSEGLAAARATDGLVDPTVGAALVRLGYTITFEHVPADGPKLQLRPLPVAGWQSVELDLDRRRLRVPAGVLLDLGATGKALAADRSAAAASAAAGCGVIVSLGGDLACGGRPPQQGWTVLVGEEHFGPLDVRGPKVTIRAGGLATSGTTLRSWRRGGVRLHHIVDPRTGLSADTPWRAVSVTAASCVRANVAATAAVILGAAAPAWLESRHLAARLLGEDGSVTYTAGWPVDV